MWATDVDGAWPGDPAGWRDLDTGDWILDCAGCSPAVLPVDTVTEDCGNVQSWSMPNELWQRLAGAIKGKGSLELGDWDAHEAGFWTKNGDGGAEMGSCCSA